MVEAVWVCPKQGGRGGGSSVSKEDRGGKPVPRADWGQDHAEVRRVGSNS